MTAPRPGPESSAAISDDVDPPPAEASSGLPPFPDLATWGAIAFLGLPTALGAGIASGSIAMMWADTLPHSNLAPMVVALIAAFIPLVTLTGYRKSLTSQKPLPGRWVALSMPFFVVVGAGLGVLLIQVAFARVDRDNDFFQRVICEADGVHSGAAFDACKPVAQVCIDEVLAESRFATRGDAVDCVRSRGALP